MSDLSNRVLACICNCPKVAESIALICNPQKVEREHGW